MPNKPKPRTLGAEPLEERLPISSSAAGVLFGFGLTQNEPGVERSATPGYEASQTPHTESVTLQPALVDLTLDLQLDALAVDIVHAEASLDTTSSAADDPFILTPLTPGAALSDAKIDAHRELGDELLLFQISTLDFHQVSFEPMTPHWESPKESFSLDFSDALTPPEDLTAYGYSPIANDLKKDDGSGGPQMSCGCGCEGGGCGCGCEPPYVISACIWGGVGCGTTQTNISRDIWGEYGYYPTDKTMLVFQNGNTVSIYTGMSWAAATGTGTITVTPGKNVPGWVYTGDPNWAGYFDTTTITSGIFCTAGGFSHTFVWTKPDGVANKDAPRDFKFTYEVSGGNSVELFFHICYAEIKSVDFDDHGVLKSNWEKVNTEWVKNDTFTFTGTPKSSIGPNWDVDRKDASGGFVTVGASYTKGAYAKVDAVFEMDFGGKDLSYQITGTGTNMNFLSGTLTGVTGSGVTMTSSTTLPGSINKITTDLTWSIIINGISFGAGKSGGHTIYTTYDTPIVEEEATEKRMDWACSAAMGNTTPLSIAYKIRDATRATIFGNPIPLEQSWVLLDGKAGDCDDQARLMQRGCQILGLPAEQKNIFASTDNDCLSMEFQPNNIRRLIFDFSTTPGVRKWNNYEGTCYVAGYYFAITPELVSNSPLGILLSLKTMGVTQWYVDEFGHYTPVGPIAFPV